MVLGIGIDAVTISEIARYWPEDGGAGSPLDPFIRRSFSEREIAQARERGSAGASFLAGRFAIKEAVFKAVAPRTSSGFDLRLVSSYDDADGAPHLEVTDALVPVLAEAGVREVLISVTNEGDIATAFALAQ
ncbi:MAG: holo-ACP synthase [Collinsella sp.]|nr:holo-ACP synthase [Collinsella sp.]